MLITTTMFSLKVPMWKISLNANYVESDWLGCYLLFEPLEVPINKDRGSCLSSITNLCLKITFQTIKQEPLPHPNNKKIERHYQQLKFSYLLLVTQEISQSFWSPCFCPQKLYISFFCFSFLTFVCYFGLNSCCCSRCFSFWDQWAFCFR